MKNLEALLRGYVYFRVNGRGFWTYQAADTCCSETNGNVAFYGRHIFKGWRCFYIGWHREADYWTRVLSPASTCPDSP